MLHRCHQEVLWVACLNEQRATVASMEHGNAMLAEATSILGFKPSEPWDALCSMIHRCHALA